MIDPLISTVETEDQKRHRLELGMPFCLSEPESVGGPLLFNSPHSGRTYTSAFCASSTLNPLALRKSEDAFVDELFAGVPSLGAPLLSARFPRAYLDVNRERGELDPVLIDGPFPPGSNTSSARVLAGLGVIPRIVADGENIYPGRIPLAEAAYRLAAYYDPYHAALQSLLERTRARFGCAVLIDCHSMPSSAPGHINARRPHIVIGDRFGTAASPDLTARIGALLDRLNFDVQYNQPYAGGYITEHYGRPVNGIHVIQIEINRSLYLEEATVTPAPSFDAFRATVSAFASQLIQELPNMVVERPRHRYAAE